MLELTLVAISLGNLACLYIILVRVDQIAMRPSAITHTYKHEHDPRPAMAKVPAEHRGWFES